MLELKTVQRLLKKISKAENLREFEAEVKERWKKRYGLKEPQIRFLICVEAAERIKRIGGAV